MLLTFSSRSSFTCPPSASYDSMVIGSVLTSSYKDILKIPSLSRPISRSFILTSIAIIYTLIFTWSTKDFRSSVSTMPSESAELATSFFRRLNSRMPDKYLGLRILSPLFVKMNLSSLKWS
jgi:hypothetical protein